MKVNKITTGFVVQVYDRDMGRCLEQSFVAGDQVDYEDENGDSVDWREQQDAYQPFDMVQPDKKDDGHPQMAPGPHADDALLPSARKPVPSVEIQIVVTLQADLDESYTESQIRKAVAEVIENSVRLSDGAGLCHDLAYDVSVKKRRPPKQGRRSC